MKLLPQQKLLIMGIIDSTLSEFELSDDTQYQIEINDGEIIHIHIDSIRIECTIKEFQEFAETIDRGQQQLQADKNL